MVYILRPNNPRYLVRVRRHGCRKYEVIKKCRSTRAALIGLGKVFASNLYKRGDILMVTYDYYAPSILYAIHQ